MLRRRGRALRGVDKRFDEVKAELRTQVEAVDATVDLVLEKVGDLIKRDIGHSVVHARSSSGWTITRFD